MGDTDRPPHPVAGDTPSGHQAGDRQGGVGGEGGRDHAGPGNPPGQAAPCQEELVRPAARAPGKRQPHPQGGQHVEPHNGEVKRLHLLA